MSKIILRMATLVFIVASCAFIYACSSTDDAEPEKTVITLSDTQLNFEYTASQINITIQCTHTWTLTGMPDWCTVEPVENVIGEGGNVKVKVAVKVTTNPNAESRSGVLNVNSGVVSQSITLSQAGDNTPKGKTAKDIMKQIKMGWNNGNSLESESGETAWGNPKTTKQLIQLVKSQGFNAIRIPVRWYEHATNDANFTIEKSWMDRVQEVVDYCIEQDMYVILNTHHEAWLDRNPFDNGAELRNQKLHNLWTQVATRFKNYDSHLLFAGTNEVLEEGKWDANAATAENKRCHRAFQETFVKAVRAVGGNNAQRILIVQSYLTNPTLAMNDLASYISSIEGPNYLMAEVHFYDPSDFALTDDKKFWGTPYRNNGISSWGQEDHVKDVFGKLNKAFIEKGYMMIIGECGATRHSSTNTQMIASRNYYLTYVLSMAKENGLVPFLWDNGGLQNGGECFGLFDRQKLEVFDKEAINAIQKGAETNYPF